MKYFLLIIISLVVNQVSKSQNNLGYYIKSQNDDLCLTESYIDETCRFITEQCQNLETQKYYIEKRWDDSHYVKPSKDQFLSQDGDILISSNLNMADPIKWTFPNEEEHSIWYTDKGQSLNIDQGGCIVLSDLIEAESNKWRTEKVIQDQTIAYVAIQQTFTATLPELSNNLWITIENIQPFIHNNDCNRLQGEITVEGLNTLGNPLKRIDETNSNVLIKLGTNKSRDFDIYKPASNKKSDYVNSKSNFYSQQIGFKVPDSELNSGNIEIVISSNIKGCHKGCDLCSDYNCNIDYSGIQTISWGDILQNSKSYGNENKSYVSTRYLQGKKNGQEDGHHIKIQLKITKN